MPVHPLAPQTTPTDADSWLQLTVQRRAAAKLGPSAVYTPLHILRTACPDNSTLVL